MADIIYKSYAACPGDFFSESLLHRMGYEWKLESAVPAWFNAVFNPYSEELIYYDFVVPESGEYQIQISQSNLDETFSQLFFINITVVACPVVYDNCCTNQCNIAWLNREGKWRNYIFTGIKEFRVDIDSNKKYVTQNLEKKYSEVNGVYNGKICTTGDIPKSHVDILDSLQYAIQAFMRNDITEAWDIPILIDKRDFVKYKTDEKFFDVKIKFLYAEELLIQSQ